MTSTIDRYTKFITEQAKSEKTSDFTMGPAEAHRVIGKVVISHHGYRRTPEGEVGKFESSYGDTHVRTYKVHHDGSHIATVVHTITDEGFPNRVEYKQRSDGKPALTNYGAERTIDISDYGRQASSHEDEPQTQKESSARRVKAAVDAWHASKTGKEWLARKFKVKVDNVEQERQKERENREAEETAAQDHWQKHVQPKYEKHGLSSQFRDAVEAHMKVHGKHGNSTVRAFNSWSYPEWWSPHRGEMRRLVPGLVVDPNDKD